MRPRTAVVCKARDIRSIPEYVCMVTGNDATRNDPCSILKPIVMGSNVITGEMFASARTGRYLESFATD